MLMLAEEKGKEKAQGDLGRLKEQRAKKGKKKQISYERAVRESK